MSVSKCRFVCVCVCAPACACMRALGIQMFMDETLPTCELTSSADGDDQGWRKGVRWGF